MLGVAQDRLDAAIIAMAVDCEFTPVVARLSCLRGVPTENFRVGERSRGGTGSGGVRGDPRSDQS